jgi:hypothetical protein
MKIVSKIAFVIVFIFSAIYVYNREKYSTEIEIVDGYPIEFSVDRGDNLRFFLNSKIANKKGLVYIYTIKSQKIDSLILDVIPQAKIKDTLAYQNGFNYQYEFIYNTKKLKSGIYFIGNVVPFLVKEITKKNAITIVFPYGNLMAINNAGGRSFTESNSKNSIPANKLSLKRTLKISDEYSYFLNWIDSVCSKRNINFISDLDLEKTLCLSNTQTLLLYGYSAFWTYKQRNCFEQFNANGGNVLAVCSRLMNNKMEYDYVHKTISFKLPDNGDTIIKNQVLWNKIKSNALTVGCSYELCNQTKTTLLSFGGYKIISKEHPIFIGINTNYIAINTDYGNAVAVLNNNFAAHPRPNNKVLNFYRNEILAYDLGVYKKGQTVTGIFHFQKSKNSGKLIVIGNDNWVLKENLNDSLITKITINCINYLIKS